MDNQYTGKIKFWNDEKGFGFITPTKKGKDVFFHISQIADRDYLPAKGNSVTYELSYDDQQRPRAINVQRIPTSSPNVQFKRIPTYPPIISSLLMILFFIVLITFTHICNKSLWIPGGYVIVSIATFIFYLHDKSQAMYKGPRVPENILHFLELFGGWPGALIAQNRYRHKNKKLSYQFVFWLCVIINVGALSWFYSSAMITDASKATNVLCEHDPVTARRPDFPIKIVFIDKVQETVKLKNLTDVPINVDSWTMCSFRGSQQHPIGGVIQAGEIRSFPFPEANIWNNTEADNGGLYNSAGELVSYWKDE